MQVEAIVYLGTVAPEEKMIMKFLRACKYLFCFHRTSRQKETPSLFPVKFETAMRSANQKILRGWRDNRKWTFTDLSCANVKHKSSKGGAQMEQENAVDFFLYYVRKFLQISLDGICQEQRSLSPPSNQKIKSHRTLQLCPFCMQSLGS